MLRVLTAILALTLLSSNWATATPYPIDQWARRAAISNIQISPDGRYLGLKKVSGKGANPIIEIYNTDDLSAEPFRVNAKPMEIMSFDWVSDDNFVFRARQKVRDKVEGLNRGVYETRIALVDVGEREIEVIEERDPSIVSVLPEKPGKIMISFSEGGNRDVGQRLEAAFRPRAYWEYDLKRESKKLVIRGKISLGNIDFDGAGKPVLARGDRKSVV